MDSVLVVTSVKWIVAELIRELHKVEPDRAKAEVDNLTKPTIPSVWTKETTLQEKILSILASYGGGKCSVSKLKSSIELKEKANLNRMLKALQKEGFLEIQGRSVRLHGAGRKVLGEAKQARQARDEAQREVQDSAAELGHRRQLESSKIVTGNARR